MQHCHVIHKSHVLSFIKFNTFLGKDNKILTAEEIRCVFDDI